MAEWIQEAFEFITEKSKRNVKVIGSQFPHASMDKKYQLEPASWWTAGFWPGVLWNLYAQTQEDSFLKTARACEDKMAVLLSDVETLDHDIGFMWTLTSVADYKITGSKTARQTALLAANLLAARYNIAGNFIRAWNPWYEGDKNCGIAIIDCMMNLPLLYWASEETRDPRFKHIAVQHATMTEREFIRQDGSVFHMVNFDPETGDVIEKLGGQGFSNESSWARGGAWAIYGMALTYKFTRNTIFINAAKNTTKYFLDQLKDAPYPVWDFKVPDNTSNTRYDYPDSSAAAIAACGLLCLADIVEDVPSAQDYKFQAESILKRLYYTCGTRDDQEEQGLLRHGTGHFPEQKNLDVPLIYGDYFFVEGITRLMGQSISFGEPQGAFSMRKYPPSDKRMLCNKLAEILEPFIAHLGQIETGQYDLTGGGTVYDASIGRAETFLRLLWGVGPYTLSEPENPHVLSFVKGILNGTNPQSDYYWGELTDFDQRMVEMASLATALLLNPMRFWEPLTENEKHNLARWLLQINDYDMPQTNWLFFRVLVNIALKQCNCEWSPDKLNDALNRLDGYYLSNGWYYDGYENQIDYYIPMAFHYYALIYVKFMQDEDPQRCHKFKQRAIEFAHQFKQWFSATGAAVPYGRSLTYRFSQVAFFSALVFADVEALPWGEIKSIIYDHLRYWEQQDIYSDAGFLTVGYAYPNLIMAEGYNGPGSPYWALKTFLLLAVDDEHQFWKADRTSPTFSSKNLQVEPRMLICHSATGNEVQVFTAGQHSHEHAHAKEKYEKFVYSTTFGFSVPKSNITLKQGAFDNCLAIAEPGLPYETAYGLEDYQLTDDYVKRIWKPRRDVVITSWIIPLLPWHIRIHRIKTARRMNLADGGFSLPKFGYQDLQLEHQVLAMNHGLVSGVLDYTQRDQILLVDAEPNTNLLFRKTIIPTLVQCVIPGEHVIVHGIIGDHCTQGPNLTSNPPDVCVLKNMVVVNTPDWSVEVPLE
ncbi:DUF2264 domain-containing protein [Alicyclobacillus fastidiosus]